MIAFHEYKLPERRDLGSAKTSLSPGSSAACPVALIAELRCQRSISGPGNISNISVVTEQNGAKSWRLLTYLTRGKSAGREEYIDRLSRREDLPVTLNLVETQRLNLLSSA